MIREKWYATFLFSLTQSTFGSAEKFQSPCMYFTNVSFSRSQRVSHNRHLRNAFALRFICVRVITVYRWPAVKRQNARYEIRSARLFQFHDGNKIPRHVMWNYRDMKYSAGNARARVFARIERVHCARASERRILLGNVRMACKTRCPARFSPQVTRVITLRTFVLLCTTIPAE